MKVLFVTRGFPSQKDPMIGNYESVQAKAIAAKGHEVSVICIKFNSILHIFQNWKLRHRVVDGVHVYECNRMNLYYPFHTSKINNYAKRCQFKMVYKHFVRERGIPDVIHAHIIQHAFYSSVIKDVYNIPFVITEHWSRMIADVIPQATLSRSYVYNKADRVICVSDALSENIYKKFGVKSVVIHNMVSDHFFMNMKSERHDELFKFISVGALRKDKRFDVLIEAFAMCHFPKNVYLDIVGEGEERQIIESKIQQFDLGSQVKLLGVKKPEEVSDLLCQSDCFVLSSRLETFGIVVIEAMAKGLPVIATIFGGPETFVRPEDGILVPKENAEELSKAMKKMIENYQNFDSAEIRRYCHDSFSQDVIADKIINIYKEVINNHNQ